MEMLSSIASVAWSVILVVLGINALIIVHEFGHFLVARWCGVRCDKFYIWFDVGGYRFFRFKWGDTEYGLGWLPLGGYVKMFGQEDNPGQARAEMERAKLAAAEAAEAAEAPENTSETNEFAENASADFTGSADADKEEAGKEEHVPTLAEVERMEKALYAPDSYLAKSVPQRMAIIVAGVVMNIIFAFVCATGAYMIGFKEAAPTVGAVVPGSPAWQQGLQCGDKIIEINGKKPRRFADITTTLLADKYLDAKIERPGETEPIERRLVGKKNDGDLMPAVGITSYSTTNLLALDVLKREIPNAKRYLDPKSENYAPLYPPEYLETLELFKDGCTITQIDGIPVADYREADILFKRNSDKPLTLTVEGELKPAEGATDAAAKRETRTVTLPPLPMKTLHGCRLAMGPVTALLAGGSAERQGVEVGDIILAVDGDRDFDPVRLGYMMRQKSNAGQTSAGVTVLKKDGSEKTCEINLVPDAVTADPRSPYNDATCPTLGISYTISNRLAGDGADKGRIVKMTLLENPRRISWIFWYTSDLPYRGTSFYEETEEGPAYIGVGEKIGMPALMNVVLQSLQIRPGMTVRFHFASDEADAKKDAEKTSGNDDAEDAATDDFLDFTVVDSDDWFVIDRNLAFKADTLTVKESLPGACLGGIRETWRGVTLVFLTIRNFGTRVSMKGMGGPLMIVQVAYNQANSNFATYLIFLCLIGANLAVLNILPIPVLDGGHLVFLAYEGITGRQPNPVLFEILCWIGLLLLLTLMVWVCLLDFGLVKRF